MIVQPKKIKAKCEDGNGQNADVSYNAYKGVCADITREEMVLTKRLD
jgi:hypothetical protein